VTEPSHSKQKVQGAVKEEKLVLPNNVQDRRTTANQPSRKGANNKPENAAARSFDDAEDCTVLQSTRERSEPLRKKAKKLEDHVTLLATIPLYIPYCCVAVEEAKDLDTDTVGSGF